MMIYNKQINSLLLFILLWCTAQAQQQQKPLKINVLLQEVIHFSPQLATDSSSIGIKTSLIKEVNNAILPNLNVNYQANLGTNNNVVGPYMAFGIVPSNSRGVRPFDNNQSVLTNLGIISLDWEVYNFGAYKAQREVAQSDLIAEKSHYQQRKYQIEAIAIDQYLNLLKLQNLLLIQQNNILRNEEIRRSILSLAKSGIRPGVDTSIAGAELSKAKLNYIELNNTYGQTQLDLALISGLKQNEIVGDTTLLSQLKNQEPTLSMFNMDSVSHPLLDFYKSNYQNSLQKENLVKKSYYPKINLQAATWYRGSSVDANDHFNKLTTGLEWQRNNYLLGLGITYNLFNIRKRKLKLNTQKANSNYYLKNLEEQKQVLNKANAQADLLLKTAQQRIQEIPKQLKAAQAGYRQKLALYKNGLTDIIALNAALNILYRAETDYVDARYLYSKALFQKAIATNQIDSLLNALK